jgi:hypothetical protein
MGGRKPIGGGGSTVTSAAMQRAGWYGNTIRRVLCSIAGGQSNRQQQVWDVWYAQFVALWLVDRIVVPALSLSRQVCIYYWMLTSSSRCWHPIVVTWCFAQLRVRRLANLKIRLCSINVQTEHMFKEHGDIIRCLKTTTSVHLVRELYSS